MAQGLRWVVGGVDLSQYVEQRSANITQVLMHRGDTCTFSIMDTTLSRIIDQLAPVTVTDDLGNVKFNGLVNVVRRKIPSATYTIIEVEAVDFSWYLQKTVGNKKYLGNTIDQIAIDLVNTYIPGMLTTHGVQPGLSVLPVFSVNHLYLSDAMDKLVRMGSDSTFLMWDVSTSADLQFCDADHAPASGIVLSDDPNVVIPGYPTVVELRREDFFHEKNASQMSNRVIVRGGTYVSNTYTQHWVGNGFQTSYVLDYAPETDPNAQGVLPTVTLAGVAQTVALDTQNGFGSDQCLISMSQDSQTAVLRFATAPPSGQQIIATYVYNLPVLVSTKNSTSVSRYGTWVEYVVDTSIKSQSSAARRAFGELGQFSQPIVTLQASTSQDYVGPLGAGQLLWINVSQLNLQIQALVAKVTIKPVGGGKYVHTIECVFPEL